ncbi:hypothetical protein L208DRAFT_1142819, partial [Tricholoma matsutake]
NILVGHAVNLDNVLSRYHSTSNNDNHIKVLGDLEFKIPSITLNKIVSTTGDWSITWNKTVRAVIFAFPHRSRELAGYSETIINLFGATHVNFHQHVIAFDHAVRHRVGSHCDVELMDLHKFLNLQTSHMDNIRAAIVHTSGIQAPNTSCKKSEVCNQWNQSLCTLEDTVCRRMHICNIC